MLRSTSFFVLGDIHYPKYRDHKFLDPKIKVETDSVSTRLAHSGLGVITSDIVAESKKHGADIFLLAGDFTDIGCEEGFRTCLSYLEEALSHLGKPMLGVPGNHDLSRPLNMTQNGGRFDKFEQLRLQAPGSIKINFAPMSHESEMLPLTSDLELITLNSCLGCEELWDTTQLKEFAQRLERAGEDLSTADRYQRYDTPFINIDSLTTARQRIEASDKKAAVILTHHNLLPQKTPRLALFPELVNSGLVRHTFASLNKPVIYIHGHIHDHPIDCVQNPTAHDRLGVVTISAPLLIHGYLSVTIFTADQAAFSVSVARRHFDGTIPQWEQPRRLRFYERHKERELLSDQELAILRYVSRRKGRAKWSALTAQFPHSHVTMLCDAGLLVLKKRIPTAQATWEVETPQ